MAALTDAFFKKILAIEGKYQNRSDDNGNYCGGQLIGTNMGMSAVAVGQWFGRCPTVAEMQGFTPQTAYSFYSWYFDWLGYFQIQNQQFAELLMNAAMGSPVGAAKTAQRLLNNYGYAVSVDGSMGPQTIGALNDAWIKHGAQFYNDYRAAWIQYYKDVNKPQFLPGWLKRMENFPPLPVTTTGTAIGGGVIIGLVLLFLLSRNGN